MDKELKEIFDKYSGKEHYGYNEAKKEFLDLFSVSGTLPFPVLILDGLKLDVEFKNGGIIIKKQ